MVRNTSMVTEKHPKGYHLTEDIAEDAAKWRGEQKAYAPDRPFLSNGLAAPRTARITS